MYELVVVAVVVAAVSGGPITRHDREVVRLRAHFAQVDRELTARDVSRLSAAQRRARETHIARLRAYAAAGVFPKNTRHPGAYVPYFVDDVGTRCAMAFLIEQSGAGDYVALVAARMNYAYVGAIARDAELGAALREWLDTNGLMLDEAARIQPAYGGDPCCTIPDDPPATVATSYKVGSGAAVVTGLSTIALNASLLRFGLSRRAGGWIGVGVGTAGFLLGASALDNGDEYATWRLLNGGIGVVAVGVGLHALLGSAPAEPTHVASRFTGAPWVAPDGRSGILVNVSF
jgi:hypothetical protein